MRIKLLALLGLSLVACGGGDDGGDDAPPIDAKPGETRIQDVQNDTMPVGTAVSLKGVIVTAIDSFGARTGDIWVQDPGGGEYSGIRVFGAPLDQVATLTPGDIVDIGNAQKDEFAPASDTTGRKVTELKGAGGGMMTVTKTGTGAVPAPVVIDALMIGQKPTGAERAAEWEKWEGVLITVNNVTAFGAPFPIEIGGSMPDMTLRQFSVTGDIGVASALAAFPTGVTREACLASATGVVDYSFFDYVIFNRSTTDVATGGTACPPKENAMAICRDGIDNDGNGFKDCDDNPCIVAVGSCRATTSISAIQAARPTGGIELADVFVVATSRNNRDLWVSTSLTAAANEGIFVFGNVFGNDPDLAPEIVPGAQVRIIGRALEFNNDTMGDTLTEVVALTDVSLNTAAAGLPTPVPNQEASMLVQLATGAPFVAVLVTLNNVKVNVLGNASNFGVGELEQAGTKFFSAAGIILSLADPVGTCYATITGVWTYQVFNNQYGLLPITRTMGGVCP